MIELIPFSDSLLSEAGQLLAARHARERLLLPALPARFEIASVAETAVLTTWKRPSTTGMAAVENGRLIAYLMGEIVVNPVRGRSVWMRLPGYALSEDATPDLLQDMYAALSPAWVDYGCLTHFAMISAVDKAVGNGWFNLSFGIEQVQAMVNMEELFEGNSYQREALPDLDIRKATVADREIVAHFSDIIWRYQVKAPVWGMILPEEISKIEEGWGSLVEEEDVTIWLAFYKGEPVAIQGYWLIEEQDDNLLIPPSCLSLSIGGTRDWARRKGIGHVLTEHGLRDAYRRGYQYCETDWRSTNLSASRFWPKQHFYPTAYRLSRRLDPRIVWAPK